MLPRAATSALLDPSSSRPGPAATPACSAAGAERGPLVDRTPGPGAGGRRCPLHDPITDEHRELVDDVLRTAGRLSAICQALFALVLCGLLVVLMR